jgi:3-dehydroquinate synthase
MINLKVELPDNSYPIFIGSDLLARLAEMLDLYGLSTNAMLITDSNIDPLYGDDMMQSLRDSFAMLEKFVLPAGEKAKTMQSVNDILTAMLTSGFDRRALVIALGGGVVGDVAGFAASIYKRGINYIQVPTTLLAQVDSSIGGKTGVNHRLGKNMIGTITQPKMVWSDLSVLATLPRREILSGLAEIIKYGIIRDADLFKLVETHLEKILALDDQILPDVIYRCSQIKADIVSLDERESGLRMILNLGHTVGHALETALGYKRISHGEGVLLGIIAESRMALELGILDRQEFDRIVGLISRLKVHRKIVEIADDRLIQHMQGDKKAAKGKIRFVFPTAIGETCTSDDLKADVIRSGLDYLWRFRQRA